MPRLATRHDYEDRMRRAVGVDVVQDAEEIFARHVRGLRDGLAVAAAVPAGQVAAQGAFPEELLQRMVHPHLCLEGGVDVEGDFVPEIEGRRFHRFKDTDIYIFLVN